MNKELLIQIPLFKTLPDSELEHLAANLSVCVYSPGSIIFREGEVGDRFYIILDGDVEVIKAIGTSDERNLGVRSQGQFIGELSLINRDHLRTATVRSIGSVRLWEMTLAEFDALLARQPTLAYEVVNVLGQRLIASETATIDDLREKNQRLLEMYVELQAAQAQIVEKEKLEHELKVMTSVQPWFQRGWLVAIFTISSAWENTLLAS
jgi:CRP-like cAMP-binding protein